MANTSEDKNAWWNDLRHQGSLISAAVLDEVFGDLQVPSTKVFENLAADYNSFETWLKIKNRSSESNDALHRWCDAVLENFLGYNPDRFLKTSKIPDELTVRSISGEKLKSHRILMSAADSSKPLLAIVVEPPIRTDEGYRSVGIGRGRTTYGKLLEYLRGSKIKLGLLTNGIQFRLCYAGLDNDAWAEWDVRAWFEERESRRQLSGFLTVLGGNGTNTRDGIDFPLLKAVEDSRSKQAELATVMGQQVRAAVELLIDCLNVATVRYPDLLEKVYHDPTGTVCPDRQVRDAIYQAATRLVMRMVVALYAEARGLLSRSQYVYEQSYGVEGLFELLKQTVQNEGPGSLEDRHYGWTRLLALFRVLHDGFSHPDLNIPAYGGLLFRTGDQQSSDIVLRALAVFEDGRVQVSDDKVFAVLKHLKIGRVKIKQGRSYTMVPGIVNFSDLKTEFIGIMYEGLLDFELRSADQPLVILNLGQEPILPLNLLESKTDKELKELIGKLGREKAQTLTASEDGAEDEDSEDSDESESPDQEETDAELESGDILIDENDRRREKAIAWARRAVVAGGLVKRKKNQDEYYFNQYLDKAAENLILQVFDKDEFYLSRWGGTRKGSGTFYTKPGLAVPTARRTLHPLLYDKVDGRDIPKTPEQILSLRVCDPSCGSASFLVAALSHITDALYESLVYHRNIADPQNTKVLSLPFGTPSTGEQSEEVLPMRPDEDRFEERVRSRLRRYVVERCLYGVDLNAMAVELARLSLWIETMDPELPFGFLDHKIKVGNSLVGCWFDRFQDYPLAAWLRKGGNDEDSEKIKDCLKGNRIGGSKRSGEGVILKEMKEIILSREGVMAFGFQEQKVAPKGVHDQALGVLQKIHETSIAQPDKREQIYRKEFLANEIYRRLKEAFDAWCAVWFWPSDALSHALPKPSEFYKPGTATRTIVENLSLQYRFFHWELEFPDVFAANNSGFDAILGNPPWEISKPNSKEFFSNHDPIYRTYGKQEALRQQEAMMKAKPDIEPEWVNYCAYFKAMSNWSGAASFPYGDYSYDDKDCRISFARKGKDNQALHDRWRSARANRQYYADQNHPFRHQGSADINLYKMFAEVSYALLKPNGRLGIILPSGIYTDAGTRDLRTLFVDSSRWEWLFGFENRKKIFDIDTRFKFCPIIVEKGGQTDAIETAFMRHDLKDWEDNVEALSTPYEKSRITIFSPKSKAILELRSKRDIEIVEKIYANSVLLGDQSEDGWKIKYTREFDMTNDSHLFKPRPWWEERGYKPDPYGRLVNPDGEMALPLYQGVMIGQHDFAAAAYERGAGNRAKWTFLDWDNKEILPQFYLHSEHLDEMPPALRSTKVAFRDVSNATNERTMISSVVPSFPCGNTLGVLSTQSLEDNLLLTMQLNSFAFDFVARARLGGMHLNYFVIEETPLLRAHFVNPSNKIRLMQLVFCLNLPSVLFATTWSAASMESLVKRNIAWRKQWSVTNHERRRVRSILEACVGELFGLDDADMAHMLSTDLADPKGFWRVDSDKPVELRQTSLTLLAFKRLKEVGLDTFLTEDWQFPIDIADRLGPRYLEWQKPNATEDEIKQSWEECEMHARNILGEEGFKKFMLELKAGNTERATSSENPIQVGKQGKLI